MSRILLASVILASTVASTPVAGLSAGALAEAEQARGRATQAAAPKVVTEAPKMQCPQVLGEGVQTKRLFCDVLLGRDPAGGIIIPIPPHTGDVTLTFDLHNRQLYSEELSKTSRGYRRYTAVVGVLALDNTAISKAYVHSEFRNAKDLFDRVSAGTPGGGVKAVAPTGVESVVLTIPAEENSVSIIGLELTEVRLDGTDVFKALGRPVAVISNVMIEYRPAPARPPARRR
jgi:hypothetical protein